MMKRSLCNLTQQKMDNTTIVHICSFPPFDVYLFTLIHIRVVETSTNTTIYRRNISVEDQGQCLLQSDQCVVAKVLYSREEVN
uniref:Growth hormone/erythropoietin receptor ligand binding domain-containing protein n=1 Tax=Anguilla anguilla TaxID=7936 RepID=A0A0E9VIS0_ANGAN